MIKQPYHTLLPKGAQDILIDAVKKDVVGDRVKRLDDAISRLKRLYPGYFRDQ